MTPPNSQTSIGPRDTMGRPVRDLRISVIDNCNLRCTYCMPKEQYGERYKFLPAEELLTFDEIERLVRVFVRLGVTKIRLTGGEPLLRKDIHDLVARLATVPGVEDLALTTNGLLLARHIDALVEAGLTRVTVSLDSLDPETSGVMNGRGVAPDAVLEGIAAAQARGIDSIKINAVIQKGVNDDEVLPLATYFREQGCVLRFIEYMDVGNMNGWRYDQVVPSKVILDEINAVYPLQPLARNYRGEVASRYGYDDGEGEIGFISSVTEPFCGSCTRARLSADGGFYTCLFASTGHDLRDLLRGGIEDAQLLDHLTAIWKGRADRYSELRSAEAKAQAKPKVEMYQIGG